MRSTVVSGEVRVPGSGKQGTFSLSTVRSGDESGIAASFSVWVAVSPFVEVQTALS
jgi:hypothetical protein